MCACSWRYRHILFFRKNISIRWRNMCFSDVTPKWHQKIIPPKIAAFHRLLRRMELSNKFLSPTCAPAHGDIAPYFFFEKIFRSDGEMCVSMTPFGGLGQFGGYVTETHISPSDRNIFFSKKKYVAISSRSGVYVGERNLLLSLV